VSERKFCDVCGDRINGEYAELDIDVGMMTVGSVVTGLALSSPFHIHRDCFEDLEDKIQEELQEEALKR